jgi:hypothetical protein
MERLEELHELLQRELSGLRVSNVGFMPNPPPIPSGIVPPPPPPPPIKEILTKEVRTRVTKAKPKAEDPKLQLLNDIQQEMKHVKLRKVNMPRTPGIFD